MAAAYAALVSLMHIIHEIEHHHNPPISLDKQQAQSLTHNITFLQGFLESYNPPVSDDELADPLEMRIADVAYAAEDVIEFHIIDTIQLHNQTILTRLFNYFHSPQKVDEQIKSISFRKNLHRAIEEMKSIKKTAMSINTTEKAVVVPAASISSSTFSTVVVGFDDASIEIMDKLTGDPPDLQVVPIDGMGGIGKTTLARKVYEQKLIKEHFYICAWATISQQYNTRETLYEVYSQVTEKDKKQPSEAELGLELHKCLFGRRFLIVMDDMWSIDLWDSIQHFFPDNQNGSRILVTTRLFELSSQLNNDYSHQVSFLDEASSWDLFSKTVFGEKNICPCELKKIGKKIVDGCRGLPLSIVVVGGLLKKMDSTERFWESIGSNLTSVVNLENDKHCLRLLRLSYNHLPVHLKPCFLYMGVFEEDAEISVSRLVKQWISEGFLKPMNGESLETSAKRFLRDLVVRNLVLISKLGSTGNIKSCKIHDLVRDLCLKEGQKDGFYHILGQPQCINNERRIVIPSYFSESEVIGYLRSMPHARSLIFENEIVCLKEGQKDGYPKCINVQHRFVLQSYASEREVLGYLRSMEHARSVICKKGSIPQCRNLGLLRTLHAHKYVFSDSEFALQYVNLRHLTIFGSSFLSSACHIWNLHTIIVSCQEISSFFTKIWKMPQFRHIEFVRNNLCLRDPPSVDDDAMIIMENLHVLKGVRNFKCCGEMVKRIPNIKKLKTRFTGFKVTNFDEYYGIRNIKLLCKLESLSVEFSRKFSGCPYNLHNLTYPHSLKRLSLVFYEFFEWEESILEEMGSLPFLEKLSLRSGFFGTKGRWEIVEGQFPCLKYLSLFSCYGLEHWTAAEEESSIFPCLEHISLSYLRELKRIPREIGNIATLQKIKINGCNEEAVKSAKEMVDEQVELQGDQLPFRVVVFRDGDNGGAAWEPDHPEIIAGPYFMEE